MVEYSCEARRHAGRTLIHVLFSLLLCMLFWSVATAIRLTETTVSYVSLALILGSLMLLTAGLFLTLRYITRHYIYRIVLRNDGGYDFMVIMISGKRAICVCRVSVDDLRELIAEDSAHRERPRYDWSVSPGQLGDTFLLTICDGSGMFFDVGEATTVRIAPDGQMVLLLEAAVRHRKNFS